MKLFPKHPELKGITWKNTSTQSVHVRPRENQTNFSHFRKRGRACVCESQLSDVSQLIACVDIVRELLWQAKSNGLLLSDFLSDQSFRLSLIGTAANRKRLHDRGNKSETRNFRMTIEGISFNDTLSDLNQHCFLLASYNR